MSDIKKKFSTKVFIIQLFTTISISALSFLMAKSYLTETLENSFIQSKLTEIKNTSFSFKDEQTNICNEYTSYSIFNTQGQYICGKNLNDTNSNHFFQRAIKDHFEQVLSQKESFLKLNTSEDSKDILISQLSIFNPSYIITKHENLNKVSHLTTVWQDSFLNSFSPIVLLIFLATLWASFQYTIPLKILLEKIQSIRKTALEKGHFINVEDDEWTTAYNILSHADEWLNEKSNQIIEDKEKLNIVLESIPDAIIAIDEKGKIIHSNYQFKKFFMIKEIREKSIIGSNFFEIIQNKNLQTYFRDCIEGKGYFTRQNMELPIKGGQRKLFFDVKISPLTNLNNTTIGLVAIFIDVTKRKMAEQMREDFVANVSHEVRTPLTSIKGFIQILKEDTSIGPEQKQNFFNKIEYNSERLINLFSDVLKLSQIENEIKLTKDNIDFHDLMTKVSSSVSTNYFSKNIKLNFDFQINTIWAAQGFIEQVFTNLLDNAYKYTPENKEITIKAYHHDSEKKDIIEIIDQGCGISKEHHERLFERFYRVDQSRNQDIRGTGLGLAIVKHIIIKHNGQISVSSSKDQGTTFTVKLPSFNPNQ